MRDAATLSRFIAWLVWSERFAELHEIAKNYGVDAEALGGFIDAYHTAGVLPPPKGLPKLRDLLGEVVELMWEEGNWHQIIAALADGDKASNVEGDVGRFNRLVEDLDKIRRGLPRGRPHPGPKAAPERLRRLALVRAAVDVWERTKPDQPLPTGPKDFITGTPAGFVRDIVNWCEPDRKKKKPKPGTGWFRTAYAEVIAERRKGKA